MLFSFSRAAWLNAAVGVFAMLVVVALRRGGGGKAMGILVTLLVSLIALAVFVSVTGSANFLSERARLQSYDTSRFNAQETGLRLVAVYPFGVGPGQFESHAPISTHSAYVRSLAEQGVLGLVTVFSLLIGTLLFAGRNAALGRDTYGLGSAALFGRLVRPPGQQRVRRHAALAAPLDRGGPDLGRGVAAPGRPTPRRGRAGARRRSRRRGVRVDDRAPRADHDDA